MALDGPKIFPFGPLSTPTKNYIRLPPTCEVRFIGSKAELEFAQALKSMSVIGVDCEWRPNLIKFIKPQVALMQVGNKSQVFLFDMLVMNDLPEFDTLMTEVFRSVKVIGMSFHNDLSMMHKNLPHLEYFK